MIITIVHSFF